ncbi:S8 family serine peptidase [Cytophagales bacterium LB-30]|uniref:S8 family serine peptidase n=1 Tax=Shiella aurantiaca TaxID=3058365 RepID=A0ABT8F7Q2_9BACT|nr:S8 family serine peptidase [Shiella aurantiaca]MDN4166415.1 S8 family serine peptidase [Shiella aurantiaca]
MKIGRKIALNILLLCISTLAIGQNKHWVYVSDSRLMPPDSLIKWGQIHTYSTWLQAYSIALHKPSDTTHLLRYYPAIQRIVPVLPLEVMHYPAKGKIELGHALEQIEAQAFIEAGLNGKGCKIGIIDGGFLRADESPSLTNAIEQIADFKDWIHPTNTNPFYGRDSHQDWHGTYVWKLIAGINKQTQFGLATEATYYLARTDHGKNEWRAEEDYWVQALEWMYAQGVKIVNSSIGYSLGFDDPAQNHHPIEVNGESAISQAAQIAAEKGMLLIISAGNDGGNENWRIISLPADAKDVLSVGSTQLHSSQKAGFSAIGTKNLPYLKPEVSCYSATGTSFSAPIITGLAACLWAQDSTLSMPAIKDLIIRSSSLYPYGNNYIGFGIPNARKLLVLWKDSTLTHQNTIREVLAERKSYTYQCLCKSVTVFHKTDAHTVQSQEELSMKRGGIVIKPSKEIIKSTLVSDCEVVEIVWQ